ncbi:unnamed protein product, partial [marine sediment metagenome]
IQELKLKIQEALQVPKTVAEEELSPIKVKEKSDETLETEEYITPDLDVYPPEYQTDEYITPSESNSDIFYTEQPPIDSPESYHALSDDESKTESNQSSVEPLIDETEQPNLELTTELGLIQQEYAYDQRGSKGADINVYITITLIKTFIITIDFTHYPERPVITFPDEVKKILRDPYKTLNTLREWSAKNPSHIVDILHELEK